MSNLRACVSLAFVCMAVTVSGAEQSRRDAVVTRAEVGEGRISGTVVDDATGEPMAFVIVALSGDSQPARKILSNDRGVFEFTELPDGRYVLAPEHPGYVLPPWRPGQPARTIVVAGRTQVSGVEVRLEKGGVIEGVVRDANGRTPMDTSVHIWRCPGDILSCERLPGRPWHVDDRGRFRIFGLPEGEYVVGVDARLVSDSIPVTRLSPADIAMVERQLGGGVTPPLRSDTVVDSLPMTYVTTYAPMATDMGGASRVTVSQGSVASGINVTMQLGTGASVAGHLSVDAQMPSLGAISIFQDEPMSTMPPGAAVFIAGDGSFKTSPLPPGAYRLVTRAPGHDGGAWWTEYRVRLTGYDVTGVYMTVQPTVELRGRVVLETSPPPGATLGSVRLDIRRADVGRVVSSIDMGSATSSEDGTFRITSLLPGRYTISVAAVEGRVLWPKSVTAASGRELLDGPFEVSADSTDREVVVTMSSKPSVLAGTLTDAEDGRAMPEYLIVAFAVAPDLREFARRVKTSVVASDGSFRIEGLPEGEYFVGALGTSDPADVTDALLAALADASQRVTITWGETVITHLRLLTASTVGRDH